KTYAWVNLGRIAKAIDAGALDASDVTEASLVASGLVRKTLDGVRLLAKGEAPKKLKITVTGASKAAVEAVEKAGGSVTLTGPVKDAAAE
ncbi:MAG: uL15 family ribosomal protein, partial [Alphaproteobacteria bacterium]|nr:uL15 family ribosomal protein [Alphaproteobacteria bacterium]